MRNLIEHLVNVRGYPIRVLGISRGDLQRRLSEAHIENTRNPPLLTVQCVPHLRGFRRKGFHPLSPYQLLGDGFALDYVRRTTYYPLSATPLSHVSDNQRGHPLFARALLYSLSLLHEMDSLKSGSTPLVYIHASAVATKKGALIFCGESTFGKSTISGKLLKGFAKLEDDQAILLLGPKPKIIVFSPSLRAPKARLPRGENSPRTLPIAGIFWLKKSPLFAIEPMNRALFASRIMMPMVNWSQPRAVANRLAMLRELLRTVPCAELSFARQSGPLVQLLTENGFV